MPPLDTVTIAQLSRLVGTPGAPVVIDVRVPDDQAGDARMLLAASLGPSRMYRDGLAQLDAAMGLSDAFYRWSSGAVGETHNWSVARP